ncbi:FUI1 (YBL042C) [Zygosaccharomyces parabailii]|nr:FUI1 (YBL042C) [Zygosaccharomyces parabailii]
MSDSWEKRKLEENISVRQLDDAKSVARVGSVVEFEDSISVDETSPTERSLFTRWCLKLVDLLEVKQPADGGSGEKQSRSIVEAFVYNKELRPVERARRTWTWKNYVFFWISGTFNVNTWQISATGLQLGLKWWQSWICIWVGYVCVATFILLASRVGNFYHLSFPSSCRIAFGTYFSLWVVLNRVVMACVWYSTMAYLGGQCVQLMLKAIFGTNLEKRLHDGIPSPNLNNFQLMCFIIYWVFSLPFLWCPPHKLRGIFSAKAFITPLGAFALLIWSVRKCGGAVDLSALNSSDGMNSSMTAWAVIRSIMSAMDNMSTLVLNAPDFARFGKTRHSALYPQLITIPVCFGIISLMGIVCVSAAYTLYGVNYWSPLDILGRYLQNFTAGDRAGVFLIASVFAFDQLGANLSQNAIPAGTDMTALLPKFISIRRGSYICACLSLCICPWNLLASSSKFTTALSAYAVFLSAIAGVIFADYYIVRKGYINIYHCYTNKPGSYYMYNRFGTNWRAVLAYVVGIVPNFPGFLGSTGVNVPIGAMKVYYLNYFIGYLLGAGTYTALVYFFPVSGTPEGVKLTDRVWREKWIEVEDFEYERVQFEKSDLADPEFA